MALGKQLQNTRLGQSLANLCLYQAKDKVAVYTDEKKWLDVLSHAS